jgi:hypothetical protein
LFSARAVRVLDGIRVRAESHAASAGEPVGIPLLELLPLIMDIATRFASILALCPKKPPVPPTPPLPPALEAVGVTPDIWKQVNVGKYAAMQSVSGDSFTNWSINKTAKEIAKVKNIKRKAAKPLAIASLEAGRDETAEDLAIAMVDAKRTAAAMSI